MSEHRTKKKSRWIKRLFKFVLFVSIFFAISLIILGNLGGSSDLYKTSLEEFSAELTGHPTRIIKLNNLGFFPDVDFDMEGVLLYEDSSKTILAAELGRIQITISFWNLLFQKERFEKVLIENFKAKPGVFTQQELHLDNLSILSNTDDSKAKLGARGKINEVSYNFSIDLQSHDQGLNRSYSLADKSPFSFNIGDVEGSGVWNKARNSFAFEDVTLSYEQQKLLEASIDMDEDINATLKILEHGSTLNIEIDNLEDKQNMSGEIESSCFYAADFTAQSRLNRAANYLEKIFFNRENIKDSKHILFEDIELDIEKGCDPELNINDIRLPLGLEHRIKI